MSFWKFGFKKSTKKVRKATVEVEEYKINERQKPPSVPIGKNVIKSNTCCYLPAVLKCKITHLEKLLEDIEKCCVACKIIAGHIQKLEEAYVEKIKDLQAKQLQNSNSNSIAAPTKKEHEIDFNSIKRSLSGRYKIVESKIFSGQKLNRCDKTILKYFKQQK